LLVELHPMTNAAPTITTELRAAFMAPNVGWLVAGANRE
jgi:hypothetical protein